MVAASLKRPSEWLHFIFHLPVSSIIMALLAPRPPAHHPVSIPLKWNWWHPLAKCTEKYPNIKWNEIAYYINRAQVMQLLWPPIGVKCMYSHCDRRRLVSVGKAFTWCDSTRFQGSIIILLYELFRFKSPILVLWCLMVTSRTKFPFNVAIWKKQKWPWMRRYIIWSFITRTTW
jgi:hypothetical protein